MEGEGTHWDTKTIYLHDVSGEDIIKEQDKINAGKLQFTIGSIINSVKGSNGATTGRFYAWLTYKVNSAALKSLPKDVPVDMTEQEGQALDPDVKEEMKIEV